MPMIKEDVCATWNSNTKEYYEGKGFKFTKFGDSFTIDSYDLLPGSSVVVNIDCDYCHQITSKMRKGIRKPEIICCSDKCRKLMDRKRTTFTCPVCDLSFERNDTQIKKNVNKVFFCSTECSIAGFKKEKDMTKYAINQCEQCNKEYEYKISNYVRSKPRFCCVPCRNKWESENKRGEKHHRFKADLIDCTCCSKKIFVNQARLKMQDNHFCDTKCRQKWYAEVWSKSKEWKLECSERATKMMCDGVFGKTDTEPQRIVNNILEENRINYLNEYNCRYHAIDNYLTDCGLMIEVMGSFWHADHRIYPIIEHQNQHDRIIHDKRKNSYVRKNHGINILYLWEYDIVNNKALCEKLIKLYIRNKGILIDYHSFNYSNANDKICLNELIAQPYFAYKKEKLNSLIRIKDITNIVDRKQYDKWIDFKCEWCGKDKEELISHFKKKKHHYCSVKCHHDFMKGKTHKEIRGV